CTGEEEIHPCRRLPGRDRWRRQSVHVGHFWRVHLMPNLPTPIYQRQVATPTSNPKTDVYRAPDVTTGGPAALMALGGAIDNVRQAVHAKHAQDDQLDLMA